MCLMVRQPDPTRYARVREQTRDTFARALQRDAEVRTRVLSDADVTQRNRDLVGQLLVTLRDNAYVLKVSVSKTSTFIFVTKVDPKTHDSLDSFFSYNCPTNKMGKLRKTALVLLKKMQHAEIFEVMTA